MEIRSYRSVFDLERRVYSIDRLRLNPSGVPLRGIAYFLVMLALAVAAAELPGLHTLAAALPWYLRDLVLPALAATVLGAVRLEGRTFHHAAYALLRHCSTPRRLVGTHTAASAGEVWHPQDVLILPDGSDAALRSLRYTGPGAVLVAVEHERCGRAVEHAAVGWARAGIGCVVRIAARPDATPLAVAEVIALRAGAKLLIRRRRSAA